MPKPNKKELYNLIINALTEGDSFIVPSGYNWVEKSYISGFVTLEPVKQGYFSLATYSQYEIGMYEIHKYKGIVPASDKWSCNS